MNRSDESEIVCARLDYREVHGSTYPTLFAATEPDVHATMHGKQAAIVSGKNLGEIRTRR